MTSGNSLSDVAIAALRASMAVPVSSPYPAFTAHARQMAVLGHERTSDTLGIAMSPIVCCRNGDFYLDGEVSRWLNRTMRNR
jgi:hypothetical protein